MQTGSYKRPIHPMKLIILLSIALLAALIFAVCLARARREAAEREEAPLAVRLVVSDGLRTLETVIRPARLALTVVNAREGSTYDAVYRIGDGPERRIRGLRSGEERDLSYEFAFLREYGPAELRGYIACSDDPSERVDIDTTVWMAYFPAYRFLPVFRVGGKEDIPLNEHFLTIGDEGTIELPYSPHDTFLPVSARVTALPSISCPITLHEDKASNRDNAKALRKAMEIIYNAKRTPGSWLNDTEAEFIRARQARNRGCYDFDSRPVQTRPLPTIANHVPTL